MIPLMISLIVEETLTAEILKWLLMGTVVLGIVAGLVYWPLNIYLARKRAGLKNRRKKK